MLPTKIYTFQLAANQTYRLQVQGHYFKLISTTGIIDVQAKFGRLEGMLTGQGLEKTPFDDLIFINSSGADNTVKVLVGDENFIDAFTGNMTIVAGKQPQSSSFVNAQKTVINVNAELLAANAARQYLIIQNKDLYGKIYISFGAAATVGNGLEIGPGGAFELPGAISTQQIFSIGSIAANTNVVTVEG